MQWRGGGGNGADTLGYGAKAEGSFIAFCALLDTTALAKARGLRAFIASAVTERSKEEFDGIAMGIAEANSIA